MDPVLGDFSKALFFHYNNTIFFHLKVHRYTQQDTNVGLVRSFVRKESLTTEMKFYIMRSLLHASWYKKSPCKTNKNYIINLVSFHST